GSDRACRDIDRLPARRAIGSRGSRRFSGPDRLGRSGVRGRGGAPLRREVRAGVPVVGIGPTVPAGRRAVIAVAEFVSGGGTARAWYMVGCPTVGVDVIEERFVIVDATLVQRREFLHRPLLVIDVEAVVGESDWLVLGCRISLVEQTAPRFDRCAVPILGRRGSRVLDPGGQRFGAGLVAPPSGRSACRARRRCNARRRQRVLDVVIIIVEAVAEAIEV